MPPLSIFIIELKLVHIGKYFFAKMSAIVTNIEYAGIVAWEK